MPKLTFSPRMRLLACCATGALLIDNAALAQTWTGGNGNWNDPSFWDLGVPLAAGDAVVDGETGAPSVATVTAGASVGTLSISSGDEVAVSNNILFTLTGGALNNDGIFSLNSSGSLTRLSISTDTTLSGSGTLAMSDASPNQITGTTAATLTNTADHTIRGSGSIGANSIGLDNEGLIEAEGSAGLTLNLRTLADTTRRNAGTMRATNGSTLSITQGVLDNATGTLEAASGGEVTITGGTRIDGGTLTGAGSFNLGGSAELADVTSDSTINIGNNDIGEISGTITNEGTIALNSSGSLTRVSIQGDTTLEGGGLVEMSNQTSNQITGTTASTLTNTADHTIRGSGSIGANLIGLDNEGVIEAVGSAGLTLDLRTLVDTTRRNAGTLRATNGSTLSITQGVLDNATGTLEAASGGEVTITNSATRIEGGTLTGTGAFNLGGSAELADVTNESAINIANNTTGEIEGTITNTGTISLNSSGSLTRVSIQGDTTLTGGGLVEMSNETTNQITGTTASTLTNLTGNTIRGSGNIGVGLIGLDNEGLIEAEGSAGLTLQLRTLDDVTRRNAGTLRALDGSTLSITQGILDNSTGTIEAASGSEVTITNSATRIEGGTLTGTGAFNLGGSAELADVTNESAINIANNTTGEIEGTITNTGTISLNSSGSLTRVSIQGDTTLEGGGLVEMSNQTSNQITGTAISTLTNTADHTIRGSGSIGGSVIGLDNEGLIEAVGSAGLTLQLRTLADTTRRNAGTLRATNGSTLSITQGVLDNATGTLEAASGGEVTITGGSTQIDGGTLTGAGAFNFGGSAELTDVTSDSTINIGNNDIGEISGTITNEGTISLNSSGSLTRVSIQGDTTLEGGGLVEMSNQTSNQITGTSTSTLTNTADHTIRGSGSIGASLIGLDNEGLIEAVGSAGLTLNLRTLADTTRRNGATGTLRASDGSTLTISQGAFDNQGLIEAVDGSTVTYGSSATTLNNSSGTLIDGQWRAEGNGSVVEIRGPAIVDNQAEIILDGPGSEFRTVAGITTTTLEDSLTRNSGTLRVLADRDFTAANGLTNSGLLELGGGTLDAPSVFNNATGEIFGFGAVTPALGNAGTVRASGGTLTAMAGVFGGPGTVISEAGATMAIGADSGTGTLDLQGGTLSLGTNDFTVGSDYTNTAFGTGNDFDRRANVTGSGEIIGNAAAMATGGDVVADVLDLGNVRGGTSVTREFTVENTGTGADIRGALQTAVGTGNITDARLSGSGVTAQNFGPIAAGDSTGPFEVTFDATSGGDLSGQTIGVVQNFDNVADQTIALQGFATQLAEGQAAPAGPVDLGNFRVGTDGPSQSFDVTNLTAGDGAESLAIASATASGNFSGSNDLGAGLIAGGATAANAASVAVSGGTAGVNNGDLTLQYLTDGTATDAAFTAVNANSETIDVSATGFNVAQAQVTPDPVVIANQRVGGTESAALTVANTAAAGIFTEGLNAGIGGTSGDAQTNGGSIALLGGGASDSTSITASVDTTSAGAKSGSVTLSLESDGAGTSGLGTLALPQQTVAVQGDVFALAEGQLNTAPLNFGTVQVGQVVNQNLSISNIATGPAGFVEDLNANFGAASGTGAGQINGSGSVTGLLAGGTDASSMTVSVNTAAVGSINGAIDVNYFSAGAVGGVSNGLGVLGVGSDSFAVSGLIEATGTVVDQADPVINTATPVNLGNVRIGSASPSANISVTNQATGNDQAALNASIAGNGAVTAAGTFDLLLPGDTDATSLSVGLDTSAAGAINDTATLSFVSDASNIGGCAPNCQMNLASQDVQVSGAVYRLADPLLNTTDVTLAARVGDTAPSAAISVTNESPDIFTEALDASLGTAPAGFSGSGAITGLAAQGSDAGTLSVALDTGAAGTFAGDLDVNFTSSGAGTTGAADLALASGSVGLTGRVYQAAEAELQTNVIDFGIVHVGDVVAAQSVDVANTAAVAALNDTLSASLTGLPTGPFSGSGSVSGLEAGSSSSDLQVGLDTSSAGNFSFLGDFVSFASENPDMAALDLGFGSLSLMGQVNNFANPVFDGLTGDGSLTGSGTSFLLDFGTLSLSSMVTASFGVLNDVFGPADLVDGDFALPAGGIFGLSGFDSFADLAAQDLFGGLEVSFDATTEGLFSESIIFNARGQNASGFSQAFDPISLELRAQVVPLPAPLLMLLSALGGLGFAARRRRAA